MLLHTDNLNHTDLFQPHRDLQAVHEGHINRSKIGSALISEIVTVFVTNIYMYIVFVTHIYMYIP